MSRAHDRYRRASRLWWTFYGEGPQSAEVIWLARPSNPERRRWRTSSGRCLWRPGYLSRVSIEREKRMLRDMRLRLVAQKFPRALHHVMLAAWCAARLAHLQTMMSTSRHLLGASESMVQP